MYQNCDYDGYFAILLFLHGTASLDLIIWFLITFTLNFV